MVCAVYSKATDTVQIRSVVVKMHSVGFSKYFFTVDCPSWHNKHGIDLFILSQQQEDLKP